jgi:hypothetical protein
MRYYAIRYAYGQSVVNNGQRPDEIHVFPTPRHRDGWVNDWAHLTTGPGQRERISAAHPLVKRAVKAGSVIDHGPAGGD